MLLYSIAMTVRKIPAGTRIYLTKKQDHVLVIQPDKTLLNDILHVAYDVRIDGKVIIPKGTRVVGNWITESNPSIAAQLQVTRIYLRGSGQQIFADSDVIDCVSDYNCNELNNVSYLYKKAHYRSNSGITRRVAKINCRIKTLLDNNRKTIYLEIETREIPVTVTADFLRFAEEDELDPLSPLPPIGPQVGPPYPPAGYQGYGPIPQQQQQPYNEVTPYLPQYPASGPNPGPITGLPPAPPGMPAVVPHPNFYKGNFNRPQFAQRQMVPQGLPPAGNFDGPLATTPASLIRTPYPIRRGVV